MKNFYSKSIVFKSCLILLVALCCIIYGCRKEISKNTDTNKSAITNPKVAIAKTWYDNAYPVNNTKGQNVHTNSTADIDISQSLKPDWQHAASYERLGKEVIEIPVDPGAKFGLALKTNDWHTDTAYNRSYYLLIKDNENYEAYILTIIADSGYVKNDLSKLANNTYRKLDADFSGLVLYSTPKGDYLGGYGYKNGQLINPETTTTQQTGKQAIQSTAKGKIKPNYMVAECTDWYQRIVITSDGVETYVGPWTYLETTCIYHDDGTGGGGGGGSGTTNPSPPPPAAVQCPAGSHPGPPVIRPCIPANVESVENDRLTINYVPLPGDGGVPSPPSQTCSVDPPRVPCPLVSEEVVSGTGQVNGVKDPDFPSNCASWAYVAVSNGNYQVCGVTDLRFDYVTEFQNSQGKLEVDYFRASYNKTIYFEFPKKRIDGTIITPSEAARLTAIAKDNAEEILESQVEASPPPMSNTETQIMLNRYFNILKSQIQTYGGRVTLNNNYGTTSLRAYSKGLGGC